MNPQYERQLEASVRRELDALGELTAPPALAKQVLRAIEQRAAMPWYRQSWANWPVGIRATSFAVLLLAFGGLCWAGWLLSHDATAPPWLSGWYADAGALWRTLGVLVNTVVGLFGGLGHKIFLIGAAVMFVTWVMCIGVGTACVRLAMRPVRG